MNAAELVNKSEITKALRGENVYAVTDTNVISLYPELFNGVRHTAFPAGEASKTLETVGKIISDMVEAGCDRKTTVVAVGGGVVGDTAGYAAASFMRGVKWINVPSTLLAMVDSGIGGKTGVDVGGYKNVAGAFYLPERVLVCTELLRTLPEREWLCGCGEMVKHALLDEDIFRETQAHLGELLARDEGVTARLAIMSVRYKESIVAADFKEGGLRKRLNVGHTIGHAVEKLDGFALAHGEYVLLGIIAEMTMLKEKVNPGFYNDAMALARRVCSHTLPRLAAEEIVNAARADKKNAGGKIVIMLPLGRGRVEEVALSVEELTEKLSNCLSSL